MRLSLILATVVVLSVPAPAAEAPAQAKALYQQGMVHYQLEEYGAAIESWQSGFRIRPAPEFLYNIAQAYRLSNRPEKAITYYQKYLSMDSQSPDRGEAARHIRELREKLEQRPAAATASPPPAPNPPSSVTPPNEAMHLTAQAPVRERRPLYKKAWFWSTIGAVALVAGAGIVLGVELGGRDTTKSLPDVSF